MLTNDQAADLVKTLLVKAKKRVEKGGYEAGLDSWLPLSFLPPSL